MDPAQIFVLKGPTGPTGPTGSPAEFFDVSLEENACGGEILYLRPNSLGPDTSIVIQPKGLGFIAGDFPDNTEVGGNCRGSYAVDWQLARNSPDQVAASGYSVIGGGVVNRIQEGFLGGAILGGYGNVASSHYSSVGGGSFHTSSYYSAIGGGVGNMASNIATVAGGRENSLSHAYSNTPGGYGLRSSNDAETIIGMFNVFTPPPDGVPARAFTIGRGADDANRQNIFVVDVEGNVYANGAIIVPPYLQSNITRLLESLDGRKIPIGTKVALEAGKIRPAKNSEESIGVIVESRGAISLGDGETYWQGKFLPPREKEVEVEIPLIEEVEIERPVLIRRGDHFVLSSKTEKIQQPKCKIFPVIGQDGKIIAQHPVPEYRTERRKIQVREINPLYREDLPYVPGISDRNGIMSRFASLVLKNKNS